MRFLYDVIDERAGDRRPPMLSVSIHNGVVPRASITDDEHRADDLTNYKIVQRGDIVINRMRAFQGAVGQAPSEGLVSPDYLVLRLNDSLCGRYFHHLLRSRWFVSEMSSRLRGIGSLDQGNVRTPRINAEDLGDIPIDLPSARAQTLIAAFLDAETRRMDQLIATKSRMVEQCVELRQSITYSAVGGTLDRSSVGGRRASNIPWLPTIPSSWREATLRLVARLGSGHTPSRSRPEWWENCTVPWVTTGEVARLRSDRHEFVQDTRERVSELGLANSSAVVHPAGTVVLSRTASAGYSGIMASPMATSQDFVTWTCGPDLEPRFLLLCLRAMRGDLLGRLAQGSTHKTIYMPDIESIRVPLPPLEDQVEIVESAWERLDGVGELEDALASQIDLLQERRRSLITAAVTGETEVA